MEMVNKITHYASFVALINWIVVAALSGVGGSNLRLFDALEGDLILEKRLHDTRDGSLSQPKQLGTSITFLGDKSSDMFVLTNGHTICHLDGSTGETLWAWNASDES
jgi:ER membrane protein complex subunit 1